ncbi:GTPase Era [Halomicronema hongdechloris C2206]|uniref:GTPase Era n=1 Tax=Halomicronema hongdechloris C2206 TaxID=1641165 RepID=A0A1Z3HMD9_9CYAN|nr:GTPase Era [Halomicronema hongdechloris]ASC71474.1 GTPase Era [Halomicronema hongdechloris C2206]
MTTDIDTLGIATMPTAPEGFRSGFVGLVGRPNVGKSTLMNHLIGQKVAITSPVAQTTRNRLQGILSTPTAQIIFVDTPGIHKPHHELGKILVKNARAAIASVDLILFVVDSSTAAGRGDHFIAELLRQQSGPIVLGLNKSDQQPPDSEAALSLDQSYQALAGHQSWPTFKFSALSGDGSEALLQELITQLDPGPYYYPPDLVTDQPERFIMGELIREQLLLHTRQEVPHSVAITIDRVEETPAITRILATIHVERDSQKGIVIGKQGSLLKSIGSAARQQIQKLIMGKVYLELFVKVVPKWRHSRPRLEDLGYRPDA